MKAAACRLLSAVCAASAMAGCHSAPTRYYTLDAVPAKQPPVAYQGPPVRIETVHVAPALDRLEVVSMTGTGELKVDDLAYWSAPLAKLARQALCVDLIADLPPGAVLFPHLPKPKDAAGIEVDVLDVSVDRAGTHLVASWSITAPEGPTPG